MSSYPKTPNLKTHFITAYLPDVSTAGQVYVAPGFAGKIRKVTTVLNGTIDTADSTLTLKIAGTAVTGGTITLTASGSGAGDIDSCEPTGANTFTKDQAIELETNGNSGQTISIMATFELEAI